jgi:hypothetical protein
MDPRESHLLVVAAEAQALIGAALAHMTDAEIEGTGFDQSGIRDGLEIIEDCVREGEIGVAFDHLLYMVVETGISLPSASVRFLEETAAAFGLPAPSVPVAPSSPSPPPARE